MKEQVELNPGEIKLIFNETHKGKVYLSDLGMSSEDLVLSDGNMRFVVEVSNIENVQFSAVPTIQFEYEEIMDETHWITEFNGEVISDKLDHHGKSTVILLNRSKMETLLHRHENTMVIHADFPNKATLVPEKSYISIF